jgi:hypothetical protein
MPNKTPIHVFTTKYDRLVKEIKTDAHIGLPFDPKQPVNNVEYKKYTALWDTGATNSVISNKVVKELGLLQTGFITVHGVNSIDTVETYYISVKLPNNVTFTHIRASAGKLQSCDLLVGMDIIGVGDFAVSNCNNKTTLSFRFPSIEEVDFLKKPINVPTVNLNHQGQNQPCNCGSGKKYKKCCGKAA